MLLFSDLYLAEASQPITIWQINKIFRSKFIFVKDFYLNLLQVFSR